MLKKEELLKRYEFNFAIDEPITYIPLKYKKEENPKFIQIHPFTMRQYPDFQYHSQCLMYNKENVNDISVIQMNYLQYLYSLIKQNGIKGDTEPQEIIDEKFNHLDKKYVHYKLLSILSMSLGYEINDIGMYEKDNNAFIGLGKKIKYVKVNKQGLFTKLVLPKKEYQKVLENNEDVNGYVCKEDKDGLNVCDLVEETYEYDIELNYKDFDNIRQIILYQNILDYDDTYIDPTLKADLEEEKRLRNKDKDKLKTNLLMEITAIALATGYTKEYILDMTIMTFSQFIRMMFGKEQYEILTNGQYCLEKAPTHYMYYEDDEFKGMQSVDKFKKKVNMDFS